MAAPRKTRTAPGPDTVPDADDTAQTGVEETPVDQAAAAAAAPAKRRRRFLSPLDGAPIGYVGDTPPTVDAQPVRTRRFGAGRTEN